MTLVAFDFDGTLTRTDLTILLGREYDRGGEIQGLAELGLRGGVDFSTTLLHRISLLEGMPNERVDAAFRRCKLRSGAAELISELRRSDVSVAIITGGFERGVEAALERAGVAVDHVIANRLVVKNGAVTGDVEGSLIDGRKDDALERLTVAAGIDPGETIAVGNGVRDLPVLRVAETAIGFAPEPVVADDCDAVVTSIRKLRLYFEQHNIVRTG